jgi:hypothetical protein
MKKKTTLLLFIACVTAVQLWAQCRIVRITNTDSTYVVEYFYDKQERFSSMKQRNIYAGKVYQSVTAFAYNDKGKVVDAHHVLNDTLFGTRHFTYENDRLVQLIDVYLADSMVLIGSFSYNNKGQLNQLYRKSNKGDTILTTYKWADEGWLKRYEDRSSYKYVENMAVEFEWDANNTIKDPDRLFFEGQTIEFQQLYLIAHTPASVKGNIKSQKYYTLNKSGQFELSSTGKLFDFKANTSNYLVGNKYEADNHVQTFMSYYEGCKN